MRIAAPLLLAAVLAGTARADPPKRQAATVAYFISLQEVAAFSPEEMTERHASGGLDGEALVADAALNDWKLCVQESLTRWAELRPGPGTLIDGAYGRCADRERAYRDSLLKVTQDGRQTIDLALAKSMMRNLEETWRPRLVAAVLDQDLAAIKGPTTGMVTVTGDAPAAATPTSPARERKR